MGVSLVAGGFVSSTNKDRSLTLPSELLQLPLMRRPDSIGRKLHREISGENF